MLTLNDIDFRYRKDAKKFFLKHEDIHEEFKADILKILNKDHPEQVNFKELHGALKGYSRIAINGYRIIYRVERDEIVVVIVAHAGSRGDIYKRFQGR